MNTDTTHPLHTRLDRLIADATSEPPARRPPVDPAESLLATWRSVCPPEFSEVTWSTVSLASTPPIPPNILGALERWLEDPAGNILIYGTVGSGKSHLAAALCHETIRRRRRRCDWTNLLRFFTEAVEHRHDTIRRYLAAELLVLDDVAAGRAELTGFQADQLYLLVNERWERHRPTVITTNAELKTAMRGYVGDRVYDRLTDGALPIRLVGDSRRGSQWR
ncbi:MAG: ATP-binding protein [Actinomycetota bacterium]|nr:ATP-binding protein [Actinomycetota bacterium]